MGCSVGLREKINLGSLVGSLRHVRERRLDLADAQECGPDEGSVEADEMRSGTPFRFEHVFEGLGMTVEQKLIALRKRLVEAQRGLIMQAANADAIPSSNALRQIADLESAIVATETMIEEERGHTS